jgi:hypothetical protein
MVEQRADMKPDSEALSHDPHFALDPQGRVGSGVAVKTSVSKTASERFQTLAPDQRARLLERAKALCDLGVDWRAAFFLPDTLDVAPVRPEPVDAAMALALSDGDWSALEKFFPAEKAARKNGTTWRASLDAAIAVACTTSIAWRDIPQASAKRARLQEAADHGTFAAIRKALDSGELTVRCDHLRKVVETMGQWRQKSKRTVSR